MKKINRIFFASFFVLLLSTNCSQDKLTNINTQKLFGVWIEDSTLDDNTKISRLEYRLNSNDKFEVFRKTLDATTQEVLGYTFKQLGDFNVDGNQLTFFNIESFRNLTSEPFTEIENLIQIFPTEPNSNFNFFSVIIEFKNNNNTLVFIYPPCGPTENCIESQTFVRE